MNKKNLLKSMFLFSRKNRVSDNILVLVTWVIVGVIIFCSLQLFDIFTNYKASEDDKKDIISAVIKDNTSSQNVDDKDDDTSSKVEEKPVEVERPKSGVVVDFEALQEINKEAIAWVHIDDTEINYAVTQTTDNDKYLHSNLYGEYHTLGTVFADYRATVLGEDVSDNITLYGHNAKNGSFFAGLLKYKSQEYFESHKFVDFYTKENPEGSVYVVIGSFITDVSLANDYIFRYNDFIKAKDEKEFDAFIDEMNGLNYLDTADIDVKYSDELLTMSTCEYSTDESRFVLVARKLRPDETMDDFK